MSAGRVPPPTAFNLILNQPQGPLPLVPRAAPQGGPENGIIWEYVVSPEHYNPYGVLHGGVVMTLLDSAMGHAVADKVHAQGRFNAVAQMSISFLAPVRVGMLRARARVTKVGKRLAFVEATAEDDAGVLVASATATHSLLP